MDKGCLKYAINDGDISLIERNGNIAAVELTSAGYKKIGSTLPAQPDLVVPDFIDERRRLQSERVVREGAKQFRDEVLGLWNRRCAITRVGVDEAIEAAHIHRYLGNATNDPRNGIPLRKDVHALFDARKLTLEIKDDTLVVCIGMSLMATPYRKLATRTIQLPMARQFWPSENCLHWHRNTNRKGEPIEKL